MKKMVLFIALCTILTSLNAQTPAKKAIDVFNEYVQLSNNCSTLKFNFTRTLVYNESPQIQLRVAKVANNAFTTAIADLTKLKNENTTFDAFLKEAISSLQTRQQQFDYNSIEQELTGKIKLTKREHFQNLIRLDNNLTTKIEEIKTDKLKEAFSQKYGFKIIKDTAANHRTAIINAAIQFDRKVSIITTHIDIFMEDFINAIEEKDYIKAEIALDSLQKLLPNINKNELKNVSSFSIGDTKEIMAKLNRIVAITQMFMDNKARPMIATSKLFSSDNTAPLKIAEIYNDAIKAYNFYIKDSNELKKLLDTYLQQFIEPLQMTTKI